MDKNYIAQLEAENYDLRNRLGLDNRTQGTGNAVEVHSTKKDDLARSEEKLRILFTYHNDPEKVPIYQAINLATSHCARVILNTVPSCPDRTLALEHIRDARMRANAAIACDGVSF